VVLLTAQASGFQNGLYTVTTAGTTGVSTVLTRHVDMNNTAEFAGAFVPVGNTGSAHPNSLWLANPSGTVTVGTTSIPFTELNRATDLVAGHRHHDQRQHGRHRQHRGHTHRLANFNQ
jgi:hypothetical protein